ncbi:MAG: B12-binding domain-containing radical SAM protein [Defluviitaleaceae bacterium]|nr:B12-binding domain-containing radical SAM protein [Defluviitaleaceae bacterium]
MKIMFAVPTYCTVNGFVPLGIGIVATVAKNAGFDVQVLLGKEGEPVSTYNERLVAEVKKQKIEIVALGTVSNYYIHTKTLLAMAKDAGAITVLGGFIVDSSPEVVPLNIGADYCVYGEGEYTFVELVNALIDGDTDISKINGLVYVRDGKLITTPPREYVHDLDSLPFIDGDLCHYEDSLENNSRLLVSFSRSCPYSCTFCSKLKGARYRMKSMEQCFREIDYYVEKYGNKIKELAIVDYLFSANKNRLLQFCERIKHYNMPFSMALRVDLVDEECLIALKEAGLHHVVYGLESASNKVLQSMGKGYTIEQAENTLALTEKHGIKMRINLIIGDIEEDLNTFSESENFFWRYAKKYDTVVVKMIVFPGTQLYRYALDKQLIKDELKYLEGGRFHVNVSKLPDTFYDLLYDKLNAYKFSKEMATRRPLEKADIDLTVDIAGKVSYGCYCPSCYSYVKLDKIEANLTMPIAAHVNLVALLHLCPVCSQYMEPRYSRTFMTNEINFGLVSRFSEVYFEKYQGSRIVIWGVTDVIRRLIIASDTLRKMIVKIVDIQHHKHKNELYCGLPVESPETLRGFHFDYVITPVVHRRNDIEQALEDMGVTAKFIEIG